MNCHKCKYLPDDKGSFEDEVCRGSDKVDRIEFSGLPLVKLFTKVESTFKAGGIPANANGAITSDGNRGKAKRNVARAYKMEIQWTLKKGDTWRKTKLTSGPAKIPANGPCRAMADCSYRTGLFS